MKLRERATKLSMLGYIQSRKKPFLHFKEFHREVQGKEYEILFFADMRVKKYPYLEVPFCYVYDPSDGKDVPLWLTNRIEREMLEELFEAGMETDSLHDFSLYRETVRDGICKLCGIDFEDDGALCKTCSKDRKKEEHQKTLTKLQELYENLPHSCKKCGVKLTDRHDLRRQFEEYNIGHAEEMIRHHLQYEPEVIAPMCRSCHAKIHLVQDPDYSEYLPVDKPRKNRKTVDMKCEKCGKQIRVKKQNIDSRPHICGECKKETESLKKQRIRAGKKSVPKGSQSAFVHRAIMAKQPVISKSRLSTLNVGIDDDYTYWSLVSRMATSVWKKKLDIIKNRIFLEYGFDNKFIKAYGTWQTKREVAYRIQEDIDWYNKHDIEVKLNFKPQSENEPSQ
ncbi:MAG: hypothetical protein ACTSWA_01690 [Candidatus Thorarchaeota archaeon]